MYPTRIFVSTFDAEPQSLSLDDKRDVAVKKLGYLRSPYVRLTQHRRDCGDGGDVLAQCSGQSIFGERLGVNGGSGRFATQFLHSVIPRKLQMMQTKVPQSVQGYPSDARSSFPQERHIIESFSRRFFAIRFADLSPYTEARESIVNVVIDEPATL
jgi:hypothetical protein